MTIEMTNAEMVNAIEVLNSLHEPGRFGYAIARNIRKIKDSCQEYMDTRDNYLREHGTPMPDGTYNIDVGQMNEELYDIATIKHTADITTVPEDEFVGGGLTSDQMAALIWMVEEPKEEE